MVDTIYILDTLNYVLDKLSETYLQPVNGGLRASFTNP